MKVLLVNSVCGFGSTGRIVAGLSRMLKDKGDEALVAYGRKTNGDDIKSIKISGTLSTLFHVFMTRGFDAHGLWSKSATHRLIKELDDFEPDIIHLHNLHGYYLNIRLLFKAIKERGIRVVWTLHDCWSFTGHCTHFDYIGCGKWKTQCEKCPQKKEYPASLGLDRSRRNYIMKRTLFNMPDVMTIVTPSDWLGNLVKSSFLQRYPVVTIHNGINHEVFKPVKSDLKETMGLADKTVLLGVASKFTSGKGISDFIRLSEKLPDTYQIVLVGLDKSQLRNLSSGIIGLPRQESADAMAELYSIADMLINPTKEDTFPTINLEALACGTPVVTYNVGGCREAINDSCGALVKRDDIDGLVRAIEKLKQHPISAQACIKQSMSFKQKDLIEQYYDIYRS